MDYYIVVHWLVSQFVGECVNMKLINVYFHRKPLISCVENQLISKHLQNILSKGFDYLMDLNSVSHLTLMYQLFARVKGGLDGLCEYFGAHVKVSVPMFTS